MKNKIDKKVYMSFLDINKCKKICYNKIKEKYNKKEIFNNKINLIFNKKHLFLSIISIFVILFVFNLTSILAVDTYSKTKTTSISLASGTYSVSGKATYHISGGTRWTYSSEYMTWKSGVGPKGYGISEKKEAEAKKEGNVQRIARRYSCYATNNNLTSQSGTAKITWYFNSSTKKFVSGF